MAVVDDEFLVRVRGADEMRYYRFTGSEAEELRGLLRQGLLDRPGGTQRLAELLATHEPEGTEPSSSTADSEVDWDMVSDDELRGYLSRRLMERKGGREVDGSIKAEADPPPGAGSTL